MWDDFSARLRAWWGVLSHEQQTGFVILLACGTIGFGFSFAYVRAQIHSPFLIPLAQVQQAQQQLQSQANDQPSDDVLRNRDTDHDGLSDWSEINVYHTSPYLADTDSDGIPDAVEIVQGTDPNCPKGHVCNGSGSAEAVGATSSTFADFLNVSQVPTTIPTDVHAPGGATTTGVGVLLGTPPEPGTMTGAQIRVYFKENHIVPDAQIDQHPDDALVQVYASAYAEAIRVKSASANPKTP